MKFSLFSSKSDEATIKGSREPAREVAADLAMFLPQRETADEVRAAIIKLDEACAHSQAEVSRLNEEHADSLLTSTAVQLRKIRDRIGERQEFLDRLSALRKLLAESLPGLDAAEAVREIEEMRRHLVERTDVFVKRWCEAHPRLFSELSSLLSEERDILAMRGYFVISLRSLGAMRGRQGGIAVDHSVPSRPVDALAEKFGARPHPMSYQNEDLSAVVAFPDVAGRYNVPPWTPVGPSLQGKPSTK